MHHDEFGDRVTSSSITRIFVTLSETSQQLLDGFPFFMFSAHKKLLANIFNIRFQKFYVVIYIYIYI